MKDKYEKNGKRSIKKGHVHMQKAGENASHGDKMRKSDDDEIIIVISSDSD